MKSLFKIIIVLFILSVAALLTIPYLFKDEIIQSIKKSTNENIEAKVDFTNADLSILSTFPDMEIQLKNISVVNKAPFEGDTLFYAKSFDMSLDIISVISGSELKIKSIDIIKPKILLHILSDEKTNFDVTKDESEKSDFKIALKNYSIKNGTIIFIDEVTNTKIVIQNVNHIGQGDFTQDDFVLNTKTVAEKFSFEFAGVKYLNKVKTTLDMELAVNLPKFKFEFRNNELKLNNLKINYNGWIAMPEEDIEMDVNFNSVNSNFKNFISLFPTIYSNDFNKIKSTGEMKFTGNVKGILSENKIPAFNISLHIKNGKIKYPDLAMGINDVNINCNINNKDGVTDHTIINLSKLDLTIGQEQFNAKLKITNPVSSPNIETKIQGKINLTNIKNALKLNEYKKLQGIITADFFAKGNLATMQKDYEKINADGEISVADFFIASDKLPEEIKIKSAVLNFNPNNINLNKFEAWFGKSDISATGFLSNFISFVLTDKILHGNLKISSNYFNLNPYIVDKGTSTKNEKQELKAFNVPQNIDFNLSSNIKKVIYDNLELDNVTGYLTIKDGKISLKNVNMNLFNGNISLDGYYEKNESQKDPNIAYNLKIKNINITDIYKKFVSVQTLAPFAKYISGNFSSNLSLSSTLDKSLLPVWNTFFSNGIIKINVAEIKNFKAFTTIGKVLNLTELSNPKVQNINPKFEIKEGKFYIKPVKFKIAGYDAVVSGSNGIDKSLNYKLDINIPSKKLAEQANKKITELFGEKIDMKNINTVTVKSIIKGTFENPEVKILAGDVVKNEFTQVTKKLTKKADEKINETKQKANEEAEKIKKEAEAKLEKEKAKAKKKLEEEKKKINEAAKKEEEKLKDKLKNEAKKKLKNLFGG